MRREEVNGLTVSQWGSNNEAFTERTSGDVAAENVCCHISFSLNLCPGQGETH